jgi:hypothetical protein
MTQLLTEAIRIANTLSEDDQNAIALTLLQVIRDRQLVPFDLLRSINSFK